jgi:methyl-accepting chemotaxis protein
MKWFHNLKIATKLIAGFVFIALIAGVVGFVGISNIKTIAEADVLLNSHVAVPTIQVGEISTYFQRARSNVLEMIALKDKEHIHAIAPKIEARLATIKKDIVEFEKTIGPDEKETFNTFKETYGMYEKTLHEMMDLAESGKNTEALALWFGRADKERYATQTALEKLVENKIVAGNRVSGDNASLAASSVTEMTIVLLIGVVSAVMLGLFVARFFSKNIQSLLAKVETIATGDLTIEISQEYKDEIGQLSQAFSQMVESLRGTINEVREASSAVASASSEISSSTEEMAVGAQEQTSQAGEVASAVEEMTKTIIENSKNASTTASTAKQAKEAAEIGGQVVEETVKGMKRIADVVNKSAETVKALGKSSDQIGDIIGVIDDIADQTNLLALNAAIEAARAGEQGRGFAVVADEVRKLAERTTKATKEIAGMIKAIQLDTTGAVSSMNEGTKQVEEGIKLADRAGSSLDEIVEVSQKVTDMVGQIAAASEEQSSASEQISKNVEGISTVTGETASGVQQIARAAEDLNRLTENLQRLVDRFKLTGESAHQRVQAAHHGLKIDVNRKDEKSKIAVRENGALVPHN